MGRPPKSSLPPALQEVLRIIGANIAAARAHRKISQNQLALRTGVSLSTLNEIETRCHRDIRISTLVALAKELDVSLVQLLRKSRIDLSNEDQSTLLKASESILRITKKIRSYEGS